MVDVVRYTPERAEEWNQFVAESKNGTFLFDRRYMDYHSDRFSDFSVMLYENKRLLALFPANRAGETVFSHQGLTYGGLVMNGKATAAKVCEWMTMINAFYKEQNVRRVVCKPLPWIYAAMPSEELIYALNMVCKARLCSRDIASVIRFDHHVPFTTLRKRCVAKARKNNVSVAFSDDYERFWQLLSDNLLEKYGAKPVHSLQEILLLKSRFKENIRLFAAFENGEMLGGTVLYQTPMVVKTQYISASKRGKEIGALDLLFDHLINDGVFTQDYFDMGTSAMDDSNELKLPLLFQKEGFGARAVCYDTYEWTL